MSTREAAARTILGAVTDGDGNVALYMKPPSAVAADGDRIPAPDGLRVAVVPCLAVTCGGGMARLAADVTLPELMPDLYRPPVRAKARDGFLPLGDGAVSLHDLADPLSWAVFVDGAEAGHGTLGGAAAAYARIAGEAASFMSLHGDDLILVALGPAVGVEKGRPVSVKVSGVAPLSFTID